ncbi:MAG: tetratricopeptide repeat protein, partial [Puniceicoccales bacterium]
MKEPESTSTPKNSPMNPPGQHHPDGAFDDPLHDWWQKNGKSLLAGAVIVIVGTAIVFGFRIYRQNQEKAIQVAYNEAVVAGSLDSFARANASYSLGGVAALQTANTAFESADWDQALEFYKLAAEGLKGNPLAGKARLGIAVTQSELGNDAEARKILSALANDK